MLREGKTDFSREAAIECSPRRKPWVGSGGRGGGEASPGGGERKSILTHTLAP